MSYKSAIKRFVKIIDETVYLLSINNKGEKETISDQEIEELMKMYIESDKFSFI